MTSDAFSESTLMPRLNPAARREIGVGMSALNPGMLRFDDGRFQDALGSDVHVPPSGGRMATAEQLLSFRSALKEAAARANGDQLAFDLEIGQALWSHSQPVRGEFGVAEVWDFITLVLAPDLASARFSPQGRDAVKQRFTGGSRRHVFQRLWKRWAVLGPEIVLTGRLTEDDYGNLLERRLTSERPGVAQAVAWALMNHPSSRSNHQRREYTRRFMRRLLMLSGIVAIDDCDQEALDAVVEHIDSAVRRDLAW